MLRKFNRILIYNGDSSELRFDINLVTEVKITSSRESYTDTASITFPNKLRNRSGALDLINIGDKVEIFLGYYPRLIKEFTGFITYVSPDSPLKIELEDRSFQLKRISLDPQVFRQTTIREVIETFYSGPTVIVDADIGDLRIAGNTTLIKILDLFRSKYGILSFFRDEVLYINASLVEDNLERVYQVNEQGNIPVGGSDLRFQRNSDLVVVSAGVTVRRDGTKLELYAFYQDNVLNNNIIVTEIKPVGALNTIRVPDLTREALEALIRRRLPLLFYTGVTGQVKTFGFPSMRHGDTVNYIDDRTPGKSGFYRLNAVTKEFNIAQGYRQTLSLGLKTRVNV